MPLFLLYTKRDAGYPCSKGICPGGRLSSLGSLTVSLRGPTAVMGFIQREKPQACSLAAWWELDVHYGRHGGPTGGRVPQGHKQAVGILNALCEDGSSLSSLIIWVKWPSNPGVLPGGEGSDIRRKLA